MADENYEPKTEEAKKLWNAYARLGDHVVGCNECLKHDFCSKFDRLFAEVLKVR